MFFNHLALGIRRRRAGRVFNPVPRDTRLLLVELRCLRPDPSCTPGLQHCWTGLFTLACIRPAPLNSDQLPSCGVDAAILRPVQMPWNPKSCFPDLLRARCWDHWEWVRLFPPDLYSEFPSFSASPRVTCPHRPFGALPPLRGGRVQPLLARKLFPREAGEVPEGGWGRAAGGFPRVTSSGAASPAWRCSLSRRRWGYVRGRRGLRCGRSG